jgi:hypothetical protein
VRGVGGGGSSNLIQEAFQRTHSIKTEFSNVFTTGAARLPALAPRRPSLRLTRAFGHTKSPTEKRDPAAGRRSPR